MKERENLALKFSFRNDGNILKLNSGGGCQHCDYPKHPAQLYSLKCLCGLS